jgi:hypothetical protein
MGGGVFVFSSSTVIDCLDIVVACDGHDEVVLHLNI